MRVQGAGQSAHGDIKVTQENGRTRQGEEGGAASQEPQPCPGPQCPHGYSEEVALDPGFQAGPLGAQQGPIGGAQGRPLPLHAGPPNSHPHSSVRQEPHLATPLRRPGQGCPWRGPRDHSASARKGPWLSSLRPTNWFLKCFSEPRSSNSPMGADGTGLRAPCLRGHGGGPGSCRSSQSKGFEGMGVGAGHPHGPGVPPQCLPGTCLHL